MTQTNTSKQLYTFTSAVFSAPSVVLVLDSINMELFLSDNVGTLFRVELSSMNTNNGTSLISNSSIDQYQMPSNILTSLFLDQCNRLWALSAQAGSQSQMLVFIQQNNSSNKSFSTMNIINLTISLPIFTNSPYNFQLDDNYSLFTANAQQGVSAFFQL